MTEREKFIEAAKVAALKTNQDVLVFMDNTAGVYCMKSAEIKKNIFCAEQAGLVSDVVTVHPNGEVEDENN